MALAPDTVLQNRYRIVRQLGQGGMGTVYEAKDLRLNTTFALKETHFTDERLRRQFEREAQLLAGLRHPALPRVIDHFDEGHGLYLVMDFIAGDDLWQMLEKRGSAFPADDVLRWADQLLDALDYLHSQNPPVIHRDIKLHNLKVSDKGRLSLLDFGLAKGLGHSTVNAATTRTVLGFSLPYAPLEQILQIDESWREHLSVTNPDEVECIRKSGTDHRSDLYSVGATLLHLLTNRVPTNAPTRAISIWSGRTDPLENVISQQAIPDRLGAVLRRSMALEPDQRFSSALEMREAMGNLVETNQLETTVLPPAVISPAPDNAQARQPAAPIAAEAISGAAANKLSETKRLHSTVAAATIASPAPSPPALPHKAEIDDAPKSQTLDIQPSRKSMRWPLIVGGLSAILVAALAIYLISPYRAKESDTPITEASNSERAKLSSNRAELVFSRADFNGYTPGAPSGDLSNTANLSVKYAEQLKSIEGVEAVTPVLRYFYSNGNEIEIVDGVDWPSYRAVNQMSLLSGRTFVENDLDYAVAMISKEKADKERVNPGDNIKLFDNRPYTLVGVFGDDHYSDVKIPLSNMQRLLEAPDKCSFILIKCKNASEQKKVAGRINSALPGNKVSLTSDVFGAVAKPSPLPALNLEGTTWEFTRDGRYKESFEFKPAGRMTRRFEADVRDGAWTRQGDRLTIKVAGNSLYDPFTIEGVVQDKQISGEYIFGRQETQSFTARRIK